MTAAGGTAPKTPSQSDSAFY